MNVSILYTPAFSLELVCMTLADALNGRCIIGKYDPEKISGTVIIVGEPCSYFAELSMIHTRNRQIWYIDVGVMPKRRFLWDQLYLMYIINKPYVIANSTYSKWKLEEHGFHVDDVIPHGIRFKPPEHVPAKDIRLLYVGGWVKKKFPPQARKIISKYRDEFVIVSNRSNPYLKLLNPNNVYYSIYDQPFMFGKTATYTKLVELYSRAKFYLNLSSSEGFGLTLLEAMSFGAIPITERIPPFVDYCSSECCYFFPWTGRIDYDDMGSYEWETYAEMYLYDPDEVIDVVEKAEWTTYRAGKCMDTASKYYYKDVYKRFREYVG